MSSTSPKLGLPYIAPAQAMKHVTHNEALVQLDAITQLAVESFGAQVPPATVQEGACFALGTGAVEAWLGQDGKLALFSNGGWQFLSPQPGWRAWGIAEAQLRVYSGGGWLAIDQTIENVTRLGVSASADATNRLAVASEASLFNHAGAGHQMKLNKAGTAETASLLLQSNFSGRAEIGLAGEDDLSLKVSADGTGFTTALKARGSDGLIEVPALRSGKVEIAMDQMAQIPTPGAGGIVMISLVEVNYPQTAHSGIFAFDSGPSLSLRALVSASGLVNQGAQALSGTTGTAGKMNISVQAGVLQLENRYRDGSSYAYTFLNAY